MTEWKIRDPENQIELVEVLGVNDPEITSDYAMRTADDSGAVAGDAEAEGDPSADDGDFIFDASDDLEPTE